MQPALSAQLLPLLTLFTASFLWLFKALRPWKTPRPPWDTIKTSATAESLLLDVSDPRACARLLASRAKESGAWLNVLPISSLRLRMDNNTIRVARLGAPLCRSHSCRHCGAEVDSLATHGLSCRWSEGRHHRHAA